MAGGAHGGIVAGAASHLRLVAELRRDKIVGPDADGAIPGRFNQLEDDRGMRLIGARVNRAKVNAARYRCGTETNDDQTALDK